MTTMSSMYLVLGDVASMRHHEEQNTNKILYYSFNLKWGWLTLPKEMEMENPNSPPDSCLTENKGIKKRAVSSHGGRDGDSKKAKIESSPKAVRETPGWLVEMIKEMKGEDPRFIFEKELTATDVNPSQSRLLMPFKGLIRHDFLTPVELNIMQEDENKKKKIGVGAMVVNSRSRTWNVSLRTWYMKNSNYSLTSGWNNIVKDNELEEGDNIGLWSFRTNGTLCFALARLP